MFTGTAEELYNQIAAKLQALQDSFVDKLPSGATYPLPGKEKVNTYLYLVNCLKKMPQLKGKITGYYAKEKDDSLKLILLNFLEDIEKDMRNSADFFDAELGNTVNNLLAELFDINRKESTTRREGRSSDILLHNLLYVPDLSHAKKFILNIKLDEDTASTMHKKIKAFLIAKFEEVPLKDRRSKPFLRLWSSFENLIDSYNSTSSSTDDGGLKLELIDKLLDARYQLHTPKMLFELANECLARALDIDINLLNEESIYDTVNKRLDALTYNGDIKTLHARAVLIFEQLRLALHDAEIQTLSASSVAVFCRSVLQYLEEMKEFFEEDDEEKIESIIKKYSGKASSADSLLGDEGDLKLALTKELIQLWQNLYQKDNTLYLGFYSLSNLIVLVTGVDKNLMMQEKFDTVNDYLNEFQASDDYSAAHLLCKRDTYRSPGDKPVQEMTAQEFHDKINSIVNAVFKAPTDRSESIKPIKPEIISKILADISKICKTKRDDDKKKIQICKILYEAKQQSAKQSDKKSLQLINVLLASATPVSIEVLLNIAEYPKVTKALRKFVSSPNYSSAWRNFNKASIASIRSDEMIDKVLAPKASGEVILSEESLSEEETPSEKKTSLEEFQTEESSLVDPPRT